MVDSKGNTYKSLMEIRYADVLLMYAESMNEQSKMTSDIWDKTIKPLRERAGFDAAYCSYPGSSDLRQVIRDERRVELALEGRRVIRRSRAREPHTSRPALQVPPSSTMAVTSSARMPTT